MVFARVCSGTFLFANYLSDLIETCTLDRGRFINIVYAGDILFFTRKRGSMFFSGVGLCVCLCVGLRLGYCDVDTQSAVEQFQLADETLFERVLNDDRHVLHSLLPPRTEYSYNLRRRRHDYELIAKTRTLNINNFIMRMLYKNFQIMRTCHIFY